MGLRAVIETPLGAIRLLLLPDRAPLSVGSFLAHVDAGRYAGSSFYRAARRDNEVWPEHPAMLLQGGLGMSDPSPLPRVAHEDSELTGLMPDRGTIALARTVPGTGCSEFFLNLADNLSMRPGGGRGDGLGVAVFGLVEAGLEVADAILAGPVGGSDPACPEPLRGQLLNPPVPILGVQRG